MDLGLDGKVALVGGGSHGLGRGTAEVLAREGMGIAFYALDDDALHRAQEELSQLSGRSVLAIPADVSRSDDCRRVIDATVDAFGGLDVLVINTGGSYGKPLPEDDASWSQAWEMWAMSAIRLAQLAVPRLCARGGGSIITITSCGVHQVVPETAVSEIPRLATTGFLKYLALQVASEGIRVNNVLPGWVAGERAEKRMREESAQRGVPVEQLMAEECAPIPMKRFATATEIGEAIAFLASDRAGYITGVNLRVDGGWCLDPVA